ncbi:ABC1 kinase family protein [Rubrivirga sp. IMCC45206]|uniref:ABC1 kinase family protein n=1 Tax=Rubrivirga sp. IMCC45206 TaxID=3391614 RepID=UPI00398FDE31
MAAPPLPPPDDAPSDSGGAKSEPVPVSEIDDGFSPPSDAAGGPEPAAAFEGDALAGGDGLAADDGLDTDPEVGDERPPGPAGDNPTATTHASAAPGPVRASPLLPSRRTPREETEKSVAADLRRLARMRRHAGTTDVPALDPGTEAARAAGYEVMDVGEPPSLVRRYFTTLRHAVGLVYGTAIAVARDRDQFVWVKGFPLILIKLAAFFVTPFVRRDIRGLPIEQQLRRRLELLGPTYIKLGQVLALREDLLPPSITEELKNLLDRLPVMPYPEYLDRIAKGLGRPIDEMFASIDPEPLGSASIGQIHGATTVEGDDVILKVVKPHIYVILKRDARLLGFFGSFLQIFFARYQPKKVLDEFAEYTLREVDLRREAENAEQMALNFADVPDIRFPKIYRQYSSRLVLTQERFRGVRPDTAASRALPLAARERLVDLGALAIIRMLYQDGFFHADLHPGNMFVLDTEPDEQGRIRPKVGFIDLGMVGYFDGDLRRTLLYYFFSLVTGDAENAARYLASVSEPGKNADPRGFQRAVAELCRRFYRAQQYGEVNVGQLIMESVGLAGQYRMYFPVEMVLMTKALVTFEGVGQTLLPGFDVAEVSRQHVNKLFLSQFNPIALLKESFRGAPELVDLIVKSPTLLAEGIRFIETRVRHPQDSPLAGLRTALLSGASLVAGTLAASTGGPWFLWGPLFVLAAGFAMKRR